MNLFRTVVAARAIVLARTKSGPAAPTAEQATPLGWL